MAKAAVAVLAVGVFGTASAIAAANYYKLKNVTIDENAFMVADLYEAGNERTYVNKNGVEFTLVDGYETENEDSGEKITKVLPWNRCSKGVFFAL